MSVLAAFAKNASTISWSESENSTDSTEQSFHAMCTLLRGAASARDVRFCCAGGCAAGVAPPNLCRKGAAADAGLRLLTLGSSAWSSRAAMLVFGCCCCCCVVPVMRGLFAISGSFSLSGACERRTVCIKHGFAPAKKEKGKSALRFPMHRAMHLRGGVQLLQ